MLHRCDLAARYSAGSVQLFCSRLCGMFKWHEFSKTAYALSGCQVFSGERAAVLLTLMSACLRGMFFSKPAET